MLRILVFLNHDPGLYGILPSQPTEIVTGGYKRFIEIAKRIGKYGIDLDVVESSPSYIKFDRTLHYRYHEVTTPNVKFANARLTDPWLVALKFARVGVRLAKEEYFDLILSPSENIEMCLPAFLTSRETKIPWVAIVHHLDFSKQLFINNLQCGPFRKFAINFYTMPRNIDKKLIYFLYNTASIISVSQATKEAIRHVGVTSSVFICGNGINTNQIGQTQSMKVIYDGIFVGRFVQSKGLMEALKVFEKILARDSEARFALVGGGDPTIVSMIKEEIERKNLEKNVEIFGYVEEKKKFELLKSSKIFIYPSHVEGWGIVVGEALACGLPVICYDLPAFKEVFNCEAVRMCKEGNVDLMVAETIRLLQNETERKRLGLIGQNFVRKYDWDEIAKREAQIYKLINSHQQQEYNPNGGALGK